VLVLLQDAPTEAEMKLLDMLAAIIQNMVSVPQHLVQIIRLVCVLRHLLAGC
jgi:hypothetical protein